MNNIQPDGYKLSHSIPATEHPVANTETNLPDMKVIVRCDSGDWREGIKTVQEKFADAELSVYVTVRGTLLYLTGTAEQIIAQADLIENHTIEIEKVMHDFGFRGISASKGNVNG